MRALLALGVLGLVGGSLAGFEPCPHFCTCTQTSYAGTKAKCSRLEPPLPEDTAHLVLEGFQEERLVDGQFLDLGLANLVTIHLSNSSLRHVSRGAFRGLTLLENLDLSHNKLESLDPNTFETNKRLKRLKLQGNPILLHNPHLPKDLRHFLISDSIIELNLAETKVRTLEDVQALSDLKNLEVLDLSHNELSELTDDMFTSLTNLEDLNLSFNKISHIGRDTFADIDDLTSLNLRGNPIRTLEGIEILGLKELDVSQCMFEMLSASTLEGFVELSSLNLSSNSILTIDMDTFTSVPNLRYLDLSYNKLRGPFNLLLFEFNKKLETLSFRGNTEIKYMPGFKGDFPLLYRYDISKCGLTSISNNTFKGMYNLDTVNVSGNSLVHIDPRTFVNLNKLTVLDLSNNLLHALHSKIFSGNKNLFKLDLSGNYFRHLPPTLFQPIPKLHWLDVSHCHLIALWNISESFTMRNLNILSKLSYLNLAGNRLTKLHKHYFISMEKLEKLDISNNPIECTPDFSHVMQWLIVNRVVPNKGREDERPISLDLIQNNVAWDEVLRAVCPLDLPSYDSPPVFHVPTKDLPRVPDVESVQIPVLEEPALLWPMALIWVSIFSILFALVNLVALLIYRSRRNYKILGYPPRPQFSLDGHFQVRRGGRSLYQKLYEECSVPAPVHDNGKKVRFVAILGNALGKNNEQV